MRDKHIIRNYGLCGSCSAAVSNGDWSHLDAWYDQEAAGFLYARITDTLSRWGWINPIGMEISGTCCELCGGRGYYELTLWESAGLILHPWGDDSGLGYLPHVVSPVREDAYLSLLLAMRDCPVWSASSRETTDLLVMLDWVAQHHPSLCPSVRWLREVVLAMHADGLYPWGPLECDERYARAL